MREVVIVSGCRLAQTKLGGIFKGVRADQMGSHVIREAINRSKISPEDVDLAVMGQVVQTPEAGNFARFCLLQDGQPVDIPAFTVQLQCCSGLEAINLAAQEIMLGKAEVCVAGGVENMSRVPHYLYDYRWGVKRSHGQLVDGLLQIADSASSYRWGQLNMGLLAEINRREYGWTRKQQDEIALRSHRLAIDAIESGRFAAEITPFTVKTRRETVVVDTDQHPRKDASLESLAALPTAFEENGTVTAGNSSGVNDGAAALVLMSQDKARELGIKPLVKIKALGRIAAHPHKMCSTPAPAAQKVLDQAGIKAREVDLWEINEAFSTVVLSSVHDLGIELDKVNVNGGGIALGHPVGCSGARIMVTLIYEMKRRQRRLGMASVGGGGGIGVATLVELAEA